MINVFVAFFLGLTVHLQSTVENLELVVTNSAGEVVGQVAAPTAGEYVFDELARGRYTVRAVVGDTVVASVVDVEVPLMESIEIAVTLESAEQSRLQEAEARRNQNIQPTKHR